MNEALQNLTELFHRDGGPLKWADSHFSTYEFHKFVLMMLTRKLLPDPTPQHPKKRKKQPPVTIVLDDKNITSTDQHKFLGVIIDTELRFKKHSDYVLGKGMKMVNQVRRLSKMARGMQGEYARRMYYAAAAATMHYANDIWCPTVPNRYGKKQRGMTGAVKKMDSDKTTKSEPQQYYTNTINPSRSPDIT
ncbi:hypothetical protein HYPSUDRAFT_196196 [Hypholoma sublateritium FD-334 SS-4]|uniref:Uncharacterized protein n=1 Tax=Hypholoma sublateritium (strain FD-334 SS-4) TaxID=945553 RepID=A0A0D2PNU5_HYPSF|nr:hypothetical protein HYPSUDRAFT_196196 [Hypholoma sublateritium FD-334 SS-4]